MTTWFAGNMMKFDGNLLEKKMSKIGVGIAYEIGRDAYNKGLDLSSIDPSEYTPIEWDNVIAGYHNAGGEDPSEEEDDTEVRELKFD